MYDTRCITSPNFHTNHTLRAEHTTNLTNDPANKLKNTTQNHSHQCRFLCACHSATLAGAGVQIVIKHRVRVAAVDMVACEREKD